MISVTALASVLPSATDLPSVPSSSYFTKNSAKPSTCVFFGRYMYSTDAPRFSDCIPFGTPLAAVTGRTIVFVV